MASDIAAADGRAGAGQARRRRRSYFQQQQNADAIVAERAAKAKAIAKRNEALRGSGGRAMVKLRDRRGAGGQVDRAHPRRRRRASGFNKLDVNKLVESAPMQSEMKIETAAEAEEKK